MYEQCCGRIHDGLLDAPTAGRLMRARYVAYSLADELFLLRTWHVSTRPVKVEFDPDLRWVGLDVVETIGGGLLDLEGTVEFVAHYEQAGRHGSLQELSRFVRSDRRWVYLDAVDAELS